MAGEFDLPRFPDIPFTLDAIEGGGYYFRIAGGRIGYLSRFGTGNFIVGNITFSRGP